MDGNVPRQVTDALAAAGYEVDRSAQQRAAETDASVLERATAGAWILVTQDRDFGDLVFRQLLSFTGVLYLRLAGMDNAAKASLVTATVIRHAAVLPGSLAVLTREHLRVRPLPRT